MHIHILGIGGTFMAGIAALAQAAGHRVTGSDQAVYPPMSEQLRALGIEFHEGYEAAHLQPAPDCVVVGNVMSRGNPAIEYMLDAGLNYRSGPQWLAEHVLHRRWVLAVAGTHGKTTTTSLLAHILEWAGLEPGFLIGGIPANFNTSARLGGSDFFVVEADEYDTAFFDKRAKFVHYHPRTVILNNLEYDHADIYPDLAAIRWQFHQLLRTVPGSGALIVNGRDPQLAEVLAMGCWTPVQPFAAPNTQSGWQLKLLQDDASVFEIWCDGVLRGEVSWSQWGEHNALNALAAVAAAQHVGVPVDVSCAALGDFRGVRRRLELRGVVNEVAVYDDFAHHPTAITVTLAALRKRLQPGQRLLALLELRSNSMRMGAHREGLAAALAAADQSFVLAPAEAVDAVRAALAPLGARAQVFTDVTTLQSAVLAQVQRGDQLLVMSNGSFGGIHARLLDALATLP